MGWAHNLKVDRSVCKSRLGLSLAVWLEQKGAPLSLSLFISKTEAMTPIYTAVLQTTKDHSHKGPGTARGSNGCSGLIRTFFLSTVQGMREPQLWAKFPANAADSHRMTR